MSKPNSSSLTTTNTSKSVTFKPTNSDSVSAATGKSPDFKENLPKSSLRYRTGQAEIGLNNGNESSDVISDQQIIDLNDSDDEIKIEPWIEEIEDESEDSNSNSKNLRTGEKSSLDEQKSIVDSNRSNLNINILNCDFVVSKKPISGDGTEPRTSSLEKCCLVKEKNTSVIDDRNNISGIEKVFNVIVGESKKLNPRQFALPREYVADIDGDLLRPEKGNL